MLYMLFPLEDHFAIKKELANADLIFKEFAMETVNGIIYATIKLCNKISYHQNM